MNLERDADVWSLEWAVLCFGGSVPGVVCSGMMSRVSAEV